MDYKVVSAFLDMVSEKWQEIARELGMSEQTCHGIREANAANSELCCSQMIVECLTGSEVKLSWSSLTEALTRLNMEHLADNILLDWGKKLTLAVIAIVTSPIPHFSVQGIMHGSSRCCWMTSLLVKRLRSASCSNL